MTKQDATRKIVNWYLNGLVTADEAATRLAYATRGNFMVALGPFVQA